ncbi:small RNA-binding protein 11, chloroplastic [Impatiens glandulifera]|uniref:small RNA-binding protein 11, chloroplastic n=1 Tax=Impatiens glandulifera TaxID=253017 RepID=UPI001FB0FEB8|nr:small RNA-binding protein 11, chloroplastic [Impatiens glandulifera]
MSISSALLSNLSCATSSSPRLSFNPSQENRWRCGSLKLHAALSDFPLASKIMIRNLSYTVTESRLVKEFSKFGHIADIKLVKDEDTKKSKGYAFIQYRCQDDALAALETMDNEPLDGRLIFLELAKPGRDAFGGYPISSGPPKEPIKFVKEDDNNVSV